MGIPYSRPIGHACRLLYEDSKMEEECAPFTARIVGKTIVLLIIAHVVGRLCMYNNKWIPLSIGLAGIYWCHILYRD